MPLSLSLNEVATITGTAGVVDELFRASGLEEYSIVPTNETWVIDYVAVEMTATAGSWTLKAAGRELARGRDVTVTTLGALDLNLVPRQNLVIPGGTRLVWNHVSGGATTTSRVRLQGKRFVRGA